MFPQSKNEQEWDNVAKEEIKIFRLSENNPKMFRQWAEKNGIDLKARSPYTEYLDVTCWGWDMDD